MVSSLPSHCGSRFFSTALLLCGVVSQIPSEPYTPQNPTPNFPIPSVFPNIPNTGVVLPGSDPRNISLASASLETIFERSRVAVLGLYATNTRPMTLQGVTATYPMFAVPQPPNLPSAAEFESLDQLFSYAPDSLFEFVQSKGLVGQAKSALTDPSVAEDTFVSSLLNDEMLFGNLFLNQIVLRRIKTSSELDTFLAKFCTSSDCQEVGGSHAQDRWLKLIPKQGLYVIDMSMFENIPPGSPVSQDIHTPGFMMILERTDMWNFRENPWAGFARSVLVDGDSEEAAVAEEEEAWRAWLAHFQGRAKSFVKASTKQREMEIKPTAVRLSDFQAAHVRHYTRATSTPTAWALVLYACKPALTAYGVVGGHMFYWHVIPGAIMRGFFNNVSPAHPLFAMVKPFSEYVNGWNTLINGAWGTVGEQAGIGPPITIATIGQVFLVMNATQSTRAPFRQLHPGARASHLGVDLEWEDEAKNMMFEYEDIEVFSELWDIAQEYVETIVDEIYESDAAVAGDVQLQAWIAAARDPADCNVLDIGDMLTKADLVYVLTYLQSMVFEHGVSRMWAFTAGNALLMPAVAPSCLASGAASLPDAAHDYSVAELLNDWVPDMAIMHEWTMFMSIFVFNPPAVSYLPAGGVTEELFFEGGPQSPKNAALIKQRQQIEAMLRRIMAEVGNCEAGGAAQTEACVVQQLQQFPRNTEM